MSPYQTYWAGAHNNCQPHMEASSTLEQFTQPLWALHRIPCTHIALHARMPGLPPAAEDMNKQNHVTLHSGSVLLSLLQQVCLDLDEQLSSQAERRQDYACVPTLCLQAHCPRCSGSGRLHSVVMAIKAAELQHRLR